MALSPALLLLLSFLLLLCLLVIKVTRGSTGGIWEVWAKCMGRCADCSWPGTVGRCWDHIWSKNAKENCWRVSSQQWWDEADINDGSGWDGEKVRGREKKGQGGEHLAVSRGTQCLALPFTPASITAPLHRVGTWEMFVVPAVSHTVALPRIPSPLLSHVLILVLPSLQNAAQVLPPPHTSISLWLWIIMNDFTLDLLCDSRFLIELPFPRQAGVLGLEQSQPAHPGLMFIYRLWFSFCGCRPLACSPWLAPAVWGFGEEMQAEGWDCGNIVLFIIWMASHSYCKKTSTSNISVCAIKCGLFKVFYFLIVFL